MTAQDPEQFKVAAQKALDGFANWLSGVPPRTEEDVRRCANVLGALRFMAHDAFGATESGVRVKPLVDVVEAAALAAGVSMFKLAQWMDRASTAAWETKRSAN